MVETGRLVSGKSIAQNLGGKKEETVRKQLDTILLRVTRRSSVR